MATVPLFIISPKLSTVVGIVWPLGTMSTKDSQEASERAANKNMISFFMVLELEVE